MCLIARDEAAFLDRCLASVAGLADEIVVVDTGSMDETVAVARRHGARVFAFPWGDDFAAARNHGLDRARGRWILALDCDEVLARRDHDGLRRAMAAADVDGYRLTTRNYTRGADHAAWVACDGSYAEQEEGYPGWFPTTKVRLWRHGPTHRFRGAVHELVEASIAAGGGRLGDCLVPIHHYGLVAKARPADRYVEAGERKAAADPDDLQARYELAVAYRDAGRLAEGLAAIEAVVAALERGAGRPHPYLQEENARLVRADVLDRLGRLEEALAAYRGIPDRFPRCFQAWNNAGSLLARIGRLEEARDAYRRGLALAPDHPVLADNLGRLERRLGGGAVASAAAGDALTPPAPARGHALSVCVIVRDGAADLDRCLASVKAAADEIVVVDTGSTDGSVAVAERHGARVGTFAWCDDFAAARNASLDLATGAWILWLDADDALAPEDLARVQRAKHLTPAVALSFTLVNTGGADRTRFRQIKMFPNRPGIRFERPVHETVLPSLRREGIEVRTTDACVQHTGYADPVVVARKTAYYARLMAAWYDDHPDDLDIGFRLGHTAYAAGDRASAAGYFDAILRAGAGLQPRSLRRHAALFRGRCRLESGDARGAIADFELALELDAGDVFAHASLGDALVKVGRHEEAIGHLRRALAGALDDTLPLDRRRIDYTAQFFLGECLSVLGRVAAAAAAFAAAHELEPQRPEALQALRQLQPALAAAGIADPAQTAPAGSIDPTARLSLCMIVRNEEGRLGTCLESARDAVDEIVVVDTGSTDATVDVARRFGAKIGHFPWCDDFAAARNASLRLATGAWVLWLDADDVLPAEHKETIRSLVAGPRDRAYFFVLDDRGFESVSCLQMRLFPNQPGVAFEMPIHEQVTPSLARLGIEMVPTEVRIVHTGYTSSAVVAAKKDRYLRIMERWLEGHPGDYIVRSHVALTYHTTGRLAEAAEQYRLIVEASDCREDRNYVVLTTALLFLGRTYQKMGDLEAALGWLRRAEEVDRNYVLTEYSIAEVCLDLGRHEEAEGYARRVVARETAQVTFFPIDQRELRYAALSVLGRAQARQGRRQEAGATLRAAAQVPVARRSEALGHLSEVLKEAGDSQGALACLDEALQIDPRHPKHLFNAGMVHLEAGRLEAARGRFEEVLQVVPASGGGETRARALLNLGFLAKARGDVDGAEARYLELLAADADNVDARANLGHLYLAAGRHAQAAEALGRVRETRPGLLDIDLGLLTALQGLGRWDGELVRGILAHVPPALAAPRRAAGAGPIEPTEAAEPLVQLGAACVRGKLTRCAEMAFAAAAACASAAACSSSAEGARRRAQRCLAELHFAAGRYWDAIARCEELLRRDPGDTDAFRRLGDCYARLGVDDAARLAYERAARAT